MVYLENKQIILSFLRLHPSTASWTLADYEVYSISSKGFLPTAVDIMVIGIKFTRSLIPKMSVFTLAISYLTMSNYFDSWT